MAMLLWPATMIVPFLNSGQSPLISGILGSLPPVMTGVVELPSLPASGGVVGSLVPPPSVLLAPPSGLGVMGLVSSGVTGLPPASFLPVSGLAGGFLSHLHSGTSST